MKSTGLSMQTAEFSIFWGKSETKHDQTTREKM